MRPSLRTLALSLSVLLAITGSVFALTRYSTPDANPHFVTSADASTPEPAAATATIGEPETSAAAIVEEASIDDVVPDESEEPQPVAIETSGDLVAPEESRNAEPIAPVVAVDVLPTVPSAAPAPVIRTAARPTTVPSPPVAVALSGTEQLLFDAHNAERLRRRTQPLVVDPTLATIARERAAAMAASGYLSHSSPGGGTSFDMMRARGFQFSVAAENIAMNSFADGQSAATAMQGFLTSGSHLHNLLDPGFGRVGIGAAARGAIKYYVVVFANP
jgi:uncharacterized protein YkwD